MTDYPRVGIDGRAILLEPRAGVETYVVNLARHLCAGPSASRPVFYLDRHFNGRTKFDRDTPPFRVVTSYRGWLRVALPLALWRDGARLAHFPSTILPPLLPCPSVVTVHSLAAHYFPWAYSEREIGLYQRVIPNSVRRATRVIAISENTRQDIVKLYGVPAERIEVIRLGASAGFSPRPLQEIERVRRQYRLPTRYLLYAGSMHPLKNLARVVRAFGAAAQEFPTCALVMAVGQHWKAEAIHREIEGSPCRERIALIGYVPEQDLPAVYSGAEAFVYPSLYEGFGLAPLEAMACGCPVLVSNTSCFPEVVGEAGLMVCPDSVEEIAHGMIRLLGDPELRLRLSQAGRARAASFRWEETARLTRELYHGVLEGKVARKSGWARPRSRSVPMTPPLPVPKPEDQRP